MADVRDGYQALCCACRRPVGEPMEDLPRARLTVNAEGDLVMRLVADECCVACGTTEVEIVVRPRRRPEAPAVAAGFLQDAPGASVCATSSREMSSNAELLALAKERLYPNYRPAPFVLVRGRGCELFDADGRRRLDLCSGIAVCVLGHAHPTLVRAIADQAATLMHVSNWFYNEPNIRAADELCRRTGFARAFFCNSGTEANEAMLKLARHHFYGIGQKERVRVVAFENAFHGRTLGSLSMTPKYREGFGPLGPTTHVPFGDADAVERAMGADVCAIIVEPVQGEGGVLPAPPGFLAKLRSIADAHGALL